MKNILFAMLQFVLFLVAFLAGNFIGPLLPVLVHIPPIVTTFANGTRGFQWDCTLPMLAILLLVLLIEALRKRLRYAAPWTLAAFTAATLAGLFMKFGFFDI